MEAGTFLNIAHRGAMAEAPENTLASFQLALKQGCNALELDVQLSADKELVVCHDPTIDRTTNGRGAIVAMTAKELKRYDAGSWFHKSYAGERIPLLREVFELVPKHVPINIELKMIPAYDHVIQRQLIQLLAHCDRMESVFVSSFDHRCLIELKQLEPAVRIGLLYGNQLVHPRKYARLFEQHVFSLHPHYEAIREAEIRDAVAHGLRVYPWTVNEAEQMRHCIRRGVSGIITNFPAKLRHVLREWN